MAYFVRAENWQRKTLAICCMFLHYLAQPMNCPDITKIWRGNVQGTGISPGSKRTFSCIKNWVIYGHQKITCLNNGQWSSPQPTCKPKGERMLNTFHNVVSPLRSKEMHACP